MVSASSAVRENIPKARGDPGTKLRQNASILVKDIMTRDVVFVFPDTTLFDLVQILNREKISSLPVVDGDKLVGIVSEGDLLQREELGASPSTAGSVHFGSNIDIQKSHGAHVKDVMTSEVLTVSENTKLEKVCGQMLEARIRQLPVVENDEVVGIISRADIVQALARRPEGAGPPKSNDDDIVRYKVIDTLLGLPGANAWFTTVDVLDGSVTLRGSVEDEDALQLSVKAIANLEHVREVDDHRAILQPY